METLETLETLSVPETAYIHIDGGCQGNGTIQSRCGIGVSFKDVLGWEFHTISRNIGEGTNNTAEYCALIAALETAVGLGIKNARILTDSALVFHQMMGDWRVKDPTLALLREDARYWVNQLIGTFWIEWVPRDANKRADALAGEALK